jgi:hypothetical protein
MIAGSTAGGSPGRTASSGGGAAVSLLAMIARGLDPVNGGVPARVSYTTTASE